MLPVADHSIWIQIATGKRPIHGDNLAINLLAQKNKLSYVKNPSPANVKQLALKTYQFFTQRHSAALRNQAAAFEGSDQRRSNVTWRSIRIPLADLAVPGRVSPVTAAIGPATKQ
jgi:hypothetical protein